MRIRPGHKGGPERCTKSTFTGEIVQRKSAVVDLLCVAPSSSILHPLTPPLLLFARSYNVGFRAKPVVRAWHNACENYVNIYQARRSTGRSGAKNAFEKKVQNKTHMKSNLHHSPHLPGLRTTFHTCFSYLKIHIHIINNTDISERVKVLSLPKRLIDNNY